MHKNITVARVEDIRSFEQLRDEWTALLSVSEERDVFLTWEWLFAWWKNIGQVSGNKLWLLTVRDGDTLIGIAPWMLNQKRKAFITVRRLENLGNPDCDVSGIISCEPATAVKAIIKYLNEHQREWDLLEIDELPLSGTNTQAFFDEIAKTSYGVIKSVENHYFISLAGKWEDYYNSLSKNLKHNLKRRKKRTEELGTVTFEQFNGESLTQEVFQTVIKLNEKGNFPDLYNSESTLAFHRDLLDLMCEQGWAQVEILSLQGKPIAFQYGFAYDGKYEDWRGGIDKEYEILAPGKLLMMMSLEKRFRTGVRENDFLRGIYSYKMDWLPVPREFASIQVFNTRHILARIAYYWSRYNKKPSKATNNQND